jgi:Ca2+-binding EF-hand superfamily protein
MKSAAFRSALAAAALGLALAGPARAEDPPPATSRFFETYDRNGDGAVTPEEFGGDPSIFRLLDKDGDGVVTPQDLGLPADFRPRRAGAGASAERRGPGGRGGREGPGRGEERQRELRQRLAGMDRNGDGKVTREEWQGPEEVFARLDRNGDGVIDEADLPAGAPPSGPGGPPPGAGRPEGGGQPGGRGERPRGEGRADGERPGGEARGQRFLERLREMDKDGDGRVSKAEWTGEMPFERLDRNGDGFLDAEDVPASPRGGMDRDPREVFREMDANGDGFLDGDELPFPQLLGRADANGDGRIDFAEFEAASRARERGGAGLTPEALRRFDANGDGKVERSEYPGSDARFEQLDRNGDGVLTAADIGPPPAGRGEGPLPGPLPPAVTPGPGGLFEAMDRDRNGKISREEFTGTDEEWRRLDRNGDGWITPEESGPPPPAGGAAGAPR